MSKTADGKHRISGSRAYKLQQLWVQRISDIYSTANTLKQTRNHVEKRIRESVHSAPEWLRVPEYVRSYIRGYHEAKRSGFDRNGIWVKWLDGRLMTTEDIELLTKHEKEQGLDTRPDYRSPWQRVDNERSCFVWKDAAGNPVYDKPLNETHRVIE